MSTDALQKPNSAPEVPRRPQRRRAGKSKAGMSMLAQGEPMIWLTGGALAIALFMIIGLIGAVLFLGLGTFVAQPIVHYELLDGTKVAGEMARTDTFDVSADALLKNPNVGDNYLRNMVDELGGESILDALPQLIEARNTQTREQGEEVRQKLETVQALIERDEAEIARRLASVRGGRGPVGDRLERIMASTESSQLKELRAEYQTFLGMQRSLESQIETNQTAIDYLAAASVEVPPPDPSSAPAALAGPLQKIVTAPENVKTSVLDALLGKLAEHRGQQRATANRWLVRVGNRSREQQSDTFKWVADYEIKPGSEEMPEWFVVVERTEWGRFYGEPRQFVIRHPRRIPADEESLDAIVTLFDQNIFSLEPALQDAVREVLEPTREELNQTRQENVARFLAQFDADGGDENYLVQALPAFGDPVELDQVAADAQIAEVHEIWETPQVAWAKYEAAYAEILARSDQRYDLKKHDLGKISRQRDAARKALRLHELEVDHQLKPVYRERKWIEDELGTLELAGADKSSDPWVRLEARYRELNEIASKIAEDGVALVAVCTEVRQYEALRDAVEKRIEDKNQLVKRIAGRFGATSPAAASAKQIIEQLNAAEVEARKEPEQKLRELRAELARATPAAKVSVEAYFEIQGEADRADAVVKQRIDELTGENSRYALRMVTASGKEESLVLDSIVRAYPANQVTGGEKAGIYVSRWWEFLTADPREANSEGGVFPAIWGTVIMTLIMAVAVAPFGVLAALYLREYASAGPVVSAVRISINNLAGVPSIVFGVFGLGFLCYAVGSYIDGGPENAGFEPVSAGKWYLWLLGLAMVAAVAFVIGIAGAGRPGTPITRTKVLLSNVSTLCWIGATCVFAYLVINTPFFSGLYEADLPNPVFGKGGVLWASLTLALLTLPVVIVATEEALAAVPNSMRDGSYGCGASKWQTIRRIVLPHALPGIMTGMILAMARGAGEVAPLMLVGAVKLAPELPLDSVFPFVHPDRSFMHLGFHIYDLGFQSQDSEAARPMVFTTTLLLIALIVALNIGAIWLRGRLRKRFQAAQF